MYINVFRSCQCWSPHLCQFYSTFSRSSCSSSDSLSSIERSLSSDIGTSWPSWFNPIGWIILSLFWKRCESVSVQIFTGIFFRSGLSSLLWEFVKKTDEPISFLLFLLLRHSLHGIRLLLFHLSRHWVHFVFNLPVLLGVGVWIARVPCAWWWGLWPLTS